MEIARELGLECISGISNIAFKSITHTAFQQILDCSEIQNYQDKSEFGDIDPVLIERCFLSLTSFIVEICKHDVGDELLRSYLTEDSKWSEERATSFLKKLGNYKEKVRARLSCVGWNYPHITSCSWKLNVIGKSNFASEKENEYIVNFDLDKENYVFQCSSSSLQDLVFKLRECSKSISNNI